MTVVTKLALTQINTRLAADNEQLRARVSQLEADVLRITECASALNAPRTTTVRDASWAEWNACVAARKQAMNAARDEALRTKRTTRAAIQ